MQGLSVERTSRVELPAYGRGGIDSHLGATPVADGFHTHREYCPLCSKRAFDVFEGVLCCIGIELKCPNCRNVVTVYIGTS